nr:hypothetical protein [uncultured Roseateles sp.]
MKSFEASVTQALAWAGKTPLPFRMLALVAVAVAVSFAEDGVAVVADVEMSPGEVFAPVVACVNAGPPTFGAIAPSVVGAVLAAVALATVLPVAAVAVAATAGLAGSTVLVALLWSAPLVAASILADVALEAIDEVEAGNAGADAIKSGPLASSAFAEAGSDGEMAAVDRSGPLFPPPPHATNKTLLAIKLSMGAFRS